MIDLLKVYVIGFANGVLIACLLMGFRLVKRLFYRISKS